jgi:hypothetical protein
MKCWEKEITIHPTSDQNRSIIFQKFVWRRYHFEIFDVSVGLFARSLVWRPWRWTNHLIVVWQSQSLD